MQPPSSKQKTRSKRTKRYGSGSPRVTDLQIKLAGRIIELAIEKDWLPGHHLKELELADALGVSRSPVRGALKFLESQGVVTTRPNHGYSLRQSGSRLQRLDLSLPEARDESLYEAIVADRVNGELADHQTEADLLRRYGVTRSLLVKTLNRLAREDVVERSHGYGWQFLPTLDSEQAHDESYRFRLLIEPAGLRQPTLQVDGRQLRQCRERHLEVLESPSSPGIHTALFELNAAFHEMLARFSGNRFVLQAVQQQNRLRRLPEYQGFRDEERIRVSCQEHLEIMSSLADGEPEWAATLLERHLYLASQLKLAFKR